MYLLLGLMCGLAVLMIYQILVRRTPVDRDADNAQDAADVQQIVDASRPAPLESRPHVKAGSAYGVEP